MPDNNDFDQELEGLKEDLDAILETDPNDLRTLLKLTGGTREEFCEYFQEGCPATEQLAFIDALKREPAVYDAVGKQLDNWDRLQPSERYSLIGTAYDILKE